jgi:hypothetical protein
MYTNALDSGHQTVDTGIVAERSKALAEGIRRADSSTRSVTNAPNLNPIPFLS